LRAANEGVQTNTEEEDVVKLDLHDDQMLQHFRKGNEDSQLLKLTKENQDLRKSVTSLKDQNERMTAIVGV
jgi:hypothetical protein